MSETRFIKITELSDLYGWKVPFFHKPFFNERASVYMRQFNADWAMLDAVRVDYPCPFCMKDTFWIFERDCEEYRKELERGVVPSQWETSDGSIAFPCDGCWQALGYVN
jgi:hypothetical protein